MEQAELGSTCLAAPKRRFPDNERCGRELAAVPVQPVLPQIPTEEEPEIKQRKREKERFGIREKRLRIALVLQGGGLGGRRGHLPDSLAHSLEAIQLAQAPQQVHFQSVNQAQKYTRRV